MVTIRRQDPVPIRTVADRRDPVELEGNAVPTDDSRTVTAPFTGTECLAYTYRAEEAIDSRTARDAPRTDDGKYEILDGGTEWTEFAVEDETGRVRVDPVGAAFDFETETRKDFPWRDPPDPIQAYVESTAAIEKQEPVLDSVPVLGRLVTWVARNDRQFVEGRLDIGETVYVRGQMREREERGNEVVIGDGPDVSEFVISDTSKQTTERRFVKRGLKRLGQAIAVLVAVAMVIYANVADGAAFPPF